MIHFTLFRDRRAATIVEFAIILPALLTLTCGTIEIGHMIFARVVLEGAVVDAARLTTASLEESEDARDQAMRSRILGAMKDFPLVDGKSVQITTSVYRDFSTSYPENYNDIDKNGSYSEGEPFTDRNGNGKWDPATPIPGKLGGPGDVVSYTAHFPKSVLFGFLSGPLGLGQEIDLSATTVVRNESVVRRVT